MTADEKFDNLEALNKQMLRIMKQVYKLSHELERTEEYNKQFEKTKYMRDAIQECNKWLQKEIDYQTEKILEKED